MTEDIVLSSGQLIRFHNVMTEDIVLSSGFQDGFMNAGFSPELSNDNMKLNAVGLSH